MEDPIAEIKKLLKNDKLVIGKEETVKGLKRSEVEKVFFTQNCDKTVRGDIVYYAQLSSVPVIELATSNTELGQVCKKPYAISVLAVRK
ncbi:ribosomal L7Ae/L30e/S12e/Gadd45 family protein [Candidatus Woesearchaeota archaeon]|nr:ribosomal L7Ae/L30e/S12e/Gadd45 family protein [Candidatus Woesearchaeota archaeon]